jgi:hypothetical protein
VLWCSASWLPAQGLELSLSGVPACLVTAGGLQMGLAGMGPAVMAVEDYVDRTTQRCFCSFLASRAGHGLATETQDSITVQH